MTPARRRTDIADMLQDLPELCYKSLLEQGMSDLEVKILRVLSKECRFLTDSTVTALKPRDFASSQVNLTSLPYETSCIKDHVPLYVGHELFLAYLGVS